LGVGLPLTSAVVGLPLATDGVGLPLTSDVFAPRVCIEMALIDLVLFESIFNLTVRYGTLSGDLVEAGLFGYLPLRLKMMNDPQ
jgi:hypothetical protein